MAFHPLSWLLRLAVLCHLALLLAGQQHSMRKCTVICNAVTPKIPLDRLASYRESEPSCVKPAIILTTVRNRTLCADPKEEWVQEAVKYLKSKDAPFHAKQTRPMTAPATRGMDRSLASEPMATAESSSQEARRPSGTSPELPRSPTTSPAPDGVPSGGPERMEHFNLATATTATTTNTTTTTTTAAAATSWRSSYQPTADLGPKGKASEAASTQAPSTQAPPTQAPSTQTPSTQTPSTQTPTISHSAPDHGQDLMPENPLGSSSAHTDAVTGPGSMPHVPVTPSREPVTTGNWDPTPKNSQRRDTPPTPITNPEATRRQAVGLLAFLGLLFCLGVAMFTYQRLQGCPRSAVGDMVEGLRYAPRSCGSNSYVLVPV